MAALRDIPMAEPALAVIARLNARANPPACRQRGELAAAWPPALAPDARAPDTLWGSTPIRAGRVDRLLRHLHGRLWHHPPWQPTLKRRLPHSLPPQRPQTYRLLALFRTQ